MRRLVLALDTSSAAVTAAVVEVSDGGCSVLAQRRHVDPRGHAEHLAPQIAECLEQTGAAPRDLAVIVAGTGPGPYTGLRVGLVTAAVWFLLNSTRPGNRSRMMPEPADAVTHWIWAAASFDSLTVPSGS